MSKQETAAAKKKRVTVADLSARIDEIETAINDTVLDEMVALADRVQALEKGLLADAPPVWGEINKRLTALEKTIAEKPDSAVTNVTDRLAELENATGTLAKAMRAISEGIADWGSRMEEAEDMIHNLQVAVSDLQERSDSSIPEHTAHQPTPAGGRADAEALKAIASVATMMGDVLMLTRVLAADQKLTDEERRQIISIACEAAGVEYSENLLTRAGVRTLTV